MYEFLHVEFDRIDQAEQVLTVGAGGEVNELLGQYASKKGFEVVSFDIDAERNPDLVGDICHYDFQDRRFDTVVLSEVLEHLHSPHLGIENTHRILKPGGRLILTTPFIFPIHDRPYDYYRFTKYGLEYLLSGFSQVDIQEKNSYFEAIDVLWMRLNKVSGKHTSALKCFVLPVVYYLKRPFTKFLSRYVAVDGVTTGYNVSAVK